MESFHTHKIEQLGVKHNVNGIVTTPEWFVANGNETKSSNNTIYDINENASNQEQDLVMQSTSSIAANSLQSFVEEALRSVEDGVASLDHRSLNMMVARQKETSDLPSSCSVTNNACPPPSSTGLFSAPTQVCASATITSTNSPCTGLDLAQVVSEIFNDNTESPESEYTALRYSKPPSLYETHRNKTDGEAAENSTSIMTYNDSIPSSTEKNYQNGHILLPKTLEPVPFTSPSRLVVSPSVLNKVLSNNTSCFSSNVLQSTVVDEADTESHTVLTREGSQSQELSNVKYTHDNGAYIHQTPVEGLVQSRSQPVSSLCHRKDLDLFNGNHLIRSLPPESFPSMDRFRLPQHPLPRSSLIDMPDKKVPASSQFSMAQNIIVGNENSATRNDLSREIPTSTFSSESLGKNTLYVKYYLT